MNAKQDLIRSFKSALAKLRLELQQNLGKINLLDGSRVEECIELFNQRLVVAQNQYLDHVARAVGTATDSVEEYKLQPVAAGNIPELATGILTTGGAVVLVKLLTFTTATSIIWGTTTASLAAIIGGLIGLSAGLTAALVGAVVFLVGFFIVRFLMMKPRRRKIRKRILKDFDQEVSPKLVDWASKQIDTALK